MRLYHTAAAIAIPGIGHPPRVPDPSFSNPPSRLLGCHQHHPVFPFLHFLAGLCMYRTRKHALPPRHRTPCPPPFSRTHQHTRNTPHVNAPPHTCGASQAREKQLARLQREETLGALPIRLASGKSLTLGDLRGSARVVVAAGTPQQVAAAVAAAEPLREELVKRGVLLVPVPIYGGGSFRVLLRTENTLRPGILVLC